jgi:SAM-dependent methyltransferase
MGFLSWNRAASRRIYSTVPWAKREPFPVYSAALAEHLKTSRPKNVVEIGPGKQSIFESFDDWGGRLIKIDISADQLGSHGNRVVAYAESLPIADNSVDLVVSQSVLEHLGDVAGFLRETHRILKPGGMTIHLCPNKFSVFAMLNQLLPKRVTKVLLHALKEGSDGICGFPARYDQCYASAMKNALRHADLSLVTLEASFCQSGYFEFFLPLFLASVAYESMVRKIHEDLAGYLFFVAQKRTERISS